MDNHEQIRERMRYTFAQILKYYGFKEDMVFYHNHYQQYTRENQNNPFFHLKRCFDMNFSHFTLDHDTIYYSNGRRDVCLREAHMYFAYLSVKELTSIICMCFLDSKHLEILYKLVIPRKDGDNSLTFTNRIKDIHNAQKIEDYYEFLTCGQFHKYEKQTPRKLALLEDIHYLVSKIEPEIESLIEQSKAEFDAYMEKNGEKYLG